MVSLQTFTSKIMNMKQKTPKTNLAAKSSRKEEYVAYLRLVACYLLLAAVVFVSFVGKYIWC